MQLCSCADVQLQMCRESAAVRMCSCAGLDVQRECSIADVQLRRFGCAERVQLCKLCRLCRSSKGLPSKGSVTKGVFNTAGVQAWPPRQLQPTYLLLLPPSSVLETANTSWDWPLTWQVFKLGLLDKYSPHNCTFFLVEVFLKLLTPLSSRCLTWQVLKVDLVDSQR